MNRTNNGLIFAAAVAVLAVSGVAWWYWHGVQQPPAPPPLPPVAQAPAPAPAPPAPGAPAIQHPIEAVQAPAEPQPAPLPSLEQSDAVLTEALTHLLGRKAVLSQLQVDGFVRRMVATVDNLARSHAPPRMWPVNPTPDRFTTERQGEQEVIGADNGLRYAPLVLLVESIDADRAVKLYATLYPLFQQAYEQLGYPGKYFNDRLIAVIDHLLATPEPTGPLAVKLVQVQGPMKMERPWVHYEFADPALESLSSGQKMLLRVGPVNERRLKARLATFRKALTGETPTK